LDLRLQNLPRLLELKPHQPREAGDGEAPALAKITRFEWFPLPDSAKDWMILLAKIIKTSSDRSFTVTLKVCTLRASKRSLPEHLPQIVFFSQPLNLHLGRGFPSLPRYQRLIPLGMRHFSSCHT